MGYFLCDRGRFGSGYVNSDARLDYAGIKQADGSYMAVHQSAGAGDCCELDAGQKSGWYWLAKGLCGG